MNADNYIKLVQEGRDAAAGAPQPAPSIIRDEQNGSTEAKFSGRDYREVRVRITNLSITSYWNTKLGRPDHDHRENRSDEGARGLGARIEAFLGGDDSAAAQEP